MTTSDIKGKLEGLTHNRGRQMMNERHISDTFEQSYDCHLASDDNLTDLAPTCGGGTISPSDSQV